MFYNIHNKSFFFFQYVTNKAKSLCILTANINKVKRKVPENNIELQSTDYKRYIFKFLKSGCDGHVEVIIVVSALNSTRAFLRASLMFLTAHRTNCGKA